MPLGIPRSPVEGAQAVLTDENTGAKLCQLPFPDKPLPSTLMPCARSMSLPKEEFGSVWPCRGWYKMMPMPVPPTRPGNQT